MSASGTVREVVALFDSQEHLQAAVDALLANGFDRADISTIADATTVERTLGRVYADVREVADDGATPRAIYISKRSLGDAEGVLIGLAVYVPTMVVAAALAAKGVADETIVWGVLIAGALGGILGYWLARRLDRGYIARLYEQLSHGGIVLWIAVHAPDQERRAVEILEHLGARDVHAHDLPIMIKSIPGWRGISYDLSFMKRLGM